MKTYYYGEPSRTLLRALLPIRKGPVASLAARGGAGGLLDPAAARRLGSRAGEVGHAIAGWCGLNSRDW
ncbi:hypothetical protein ebA1858 [Aromatoleum aromaticum EbN1]|uniref:Uncharacterized protein n=1 Tax=Aromatoleum aromaticum (strain DSM 19018 / LMG 30748 / EbN1) TaxID=76114 RepID=Q5P6C6_AROAE|nr:hypothetical protein ebA1858 [Aromatoleum aromaticum EbN1]